ncbi:hemin binding protein Hbp [Legionella busanensis]|uniref:Hemin binding protein Hbp n=1 Tax=Legionella busanensis TaxID=190655 RepID=A0A378JMR4_9GAMM|nr:DUF4949 domain-containing protein [Legionella busanensis]STX52656.1 hemin binding protein Hbp [Legionella busanensis]
MKFSKLVLALPLLVSQSIFALTSDKPDTCPSPKALALVGVSNAETIDDGHLWLTYRPSNSFETTNKWTLVIAPIEAKSASEAISKVNKSISNLALLEGPEEEDGMWGCIYSNSDNSLMAITITPPVFIGWKNLTHKFNVKISH